MRVLPMWLLAVFLGWGAVVFPAHASENACIPESSREGGSAGTSVMTVLSPRMPYALKEWPRMKAAAESAGFLVIGLRDPRVPDDEWAAAVQAAGQPELIQLPKIDETYAATLGALNHAPASLVTCCGKTHPWPILGVMPTATWLTVLRARVAQLGCSGCC